jgi:hypothetical protein
MSRSGARPTRDEDEFERIQIVKEVDRARDIIEQYHGGLALYHKRIEASYEKIGRIAERLGEPEREVS